MCGVDVNRKGRTKYLTVTFDHVMGSIADDYEVNPSSFQHSRVHVSGDREHVVLTKGAPKMSYKNYDSPRPKEDVSKRYLYTVLVEDR